LSTNIEDEELDWFMDKIIKAINYKNNNINNVNDLKKYIYVSDFKEDEFKRIKDLFNKYGKNKLLRCVMKLKDNNLNIENKTKIMKCLARRYGKKK